MKSFQPKEGDGTPPTDGGGRNPSRDFRGARRSNASHGSTSDPDALLYRKGAGMEARLGFVGHVLNRHGLVVDAELTRASGHAERLAALAMLDRLPTTGPATLGADRGFDAKDFGMELRERRVTPHVAQNTSRRRSAIDGRTTRHEGYAQSQRARKRIEEAFGWITTIAGQARTRLRGLDRVRWTFTPAAAAYNLIRLPRLIGATP
jgi:Transposase DDE domain